MQMLTVDRRELKSAGINIKVTTKKKGQMDYNADIPFEKAPAAGFYDTQEEMAQNERERDAFDPRKQQLANKRKADGQDDNMQEHKRKKNDKDSGSSAAAARAAQMQKIREAEQSSKRRGLVLPAPQVSESELEDIVKMGMSGDRANMMAEASENGATRGLVSQYSNTVGATPIRTPMARQEEDRIANELRNARARTEAQSALFGGDNAPLHEGSATTGYDGVAPSKQLSATPNPMATPLRNGMTNGPGATPRAPGATPMRTPRDSLNLNREDGAPVNQTPRDIRLHEQSTRNNLRSKLAGLPKPRETEWELELPDEQEEVTAANGQLTAEDAAARDARNAAVAEAAALADFKRQTQVVQKGLPRPRFVDVEAMLKNAREIDDPIERSIAEEMALLVANDAQKFGGVKINGKSTPIPILNDEALARAQMEVILEMGQDADREKFGAAFEREWENAHSNTMLPGLAGYAEDEVDEEQLLIENFDKIQDTINASADKGAALEKKLGKLHGGYLERSKRLRAKINEAAESLERTRLEVEAARNARVLEEAEMGDRLEGLRENVSLVKRREREAQESYRERKEELEGMVL